MVASRLRRLDDPKNLIVTVSDTIRFPSSPRLSIILPRYGLSFFINDADDLESLNFKDMVYDGDQYIGTLFGLVNGLVLRPKLEAQIEEDFIPKRIIIPHSDSLDQRGRNVNVKLPSLGPIKHYTYQVDSELGCLKGIANLESKFYLARLHFLTSRGCRPDPLTGRTGVEEATSLIWLAGTRQGTSVSYFESQNHQIQYAFAKIQGYTDRELKLLTKDALFREARLFPSEVATSACHSPGPEQQELLSQLLRQRRPPCLHARADRLPHHHPGCYGLPVANINSLSQLFSSLRTDQSARAPRFQSQYVTRLRSSADHLRTVDPTSATSGWNDNPGKPDMEMLRKHYRQCRTSYKESLDKIQEALGPETEFEEIVYQCGHWPRITPFILFRYLASTSPFKLPEGSGWKKCLISLALLALDVQRARRLLRLTLDDLEEELYKELENDGCDGWDPASADHTDWLLVQV